MNHIGNTLSNYSSPEILLAQELAKRLDDPAAMAQWLRYTKLVSHDFLREQLQKVCSMPDWKITTTRVRLFVSIIENHIKYGGNGYPRD